MCVAKTCTECKSTKPIDQFGRRAASRDGYRSCCKQCDRSRVSEWRKRQDSKAIVSLWDKQNRDKKRKYFRDYYARNAEVQRERVAAYRRENPEKVRETLSVSRAKRSESVYAKNAERTSALRMATPDWADVNAIADVYRIAAVMRRHGKDVCVDHLVPIKSAFVCGLHVKSNLQIISTGENVRKNNKYWPDMAERN